MKAKKFLLMFVLSFSLVACSQNPGVPMEVAVTPTFTPWVDGTEMALATPPWPEGTEMALSHSPEEFAAFLVEDAKFWVKLAKDSGATAD